MDVNILDFLETEKWYVYIKADSISRECVDFRWPSIDVDTWLTAQLGGIPTSFVWII